MQMYQLARSLTWYAFYFIKMVNKSVYVLILNLLTLFRSRNELCNATQGDKTSLSLNTIAHCLIFNIKRRNLAINVVITS